MKKRLLPLAALFISGFAYSQVGIGTTTPSQSAQLDIKSNDKGLLIPNVRLTSTTDNVTIKNGNVESLLVFSTDKVGDIIPGYYYWKDGKWNLFVSGDNLPEVIENILQNPVTKNKFETVIKKIGGNVSYNTITKKFETVYPGETTPKEIKITEIVRETPGNVTYNTTNNTYEVADANGQIKPIDFEGNQQIKNVVNNLIKKYKGNVVYEGGKIYYADENGVNHAIDIPALIKGHETNTTIAKHATEKGVYVYNNEQSNNTVNIDVPEAVAESFEKIINNVTHKETIKNLIQNVAGDVKFDGDKFTYNEVSKDANGNPIKDAKGNPVTTTKTISVTELVKKGETLTSFSEKDGVYTYTGEKGEDPIKINVPEAVAANFETIINNPTHKETIKKIFKNIGGDVSFDGDKFTYNEPKKDANGDVIKDAKGNPVTTTKTISVTELVKKGETLTVLEVKDDMLTYHDEKTAKVDAQGKVTSTGKQINLTKVVEKIFKDIDPTTEAGKAFIKNFNEYITKNGATNITYKDGVITYKDKDGTDKTIDIVKLINEKETLTVFDIKDDGTLIYHDEETERTNGQITSTGKTLDLTKVIAKIFKDVKPDSPEGKTFIKNFNEYITKNGATNITYKDGVITYKDKDGTDKTIDIVKLINEKETLTVLDVKNGDLIYHDENLTTNDNGVITSNGKKVDLTTVVEKIFKNIDPTTEAGKTFIKNFNEYITKNGASNITYDETTGDFTYKDEKGDDKKINIKDIAKGAETVTTLKIADDGNLVYQSEVKKADGSLGAATTISMPEAINKTFKTILAGDDKVVEHLKTFIKENGGTVKFDGVNITYVGTAKDANGDVIKDATGQPEVKEQTLPLKDVIKHIETKTFFTEKAGVYTYTGEKGIDPVNINVPEAVGKNFTKVLSFPEAQAAIKQFVQGVQSAGDGEMFFDGNNITYSITQKNPNGSPKLDGNGDPIKDVHTLTLKQFIQQGETETTLTFDEASGKLTYINETATNATGEAAKGITISIPDAVVKNFSEIIKQPGVKTELTNFITASQGGVGFDGTKFTYKDAAGAIKTLTLKDLVKKNETVTTLTFDENKGELTYKNEEAINATGGAATADGITISIPDAVVKNFSEIIKQPGVKTELTKFITAAAGGVGFDGEEFSYKDAGGVVKTLTLKDLVKQNETLTVFDVQADGTLVYHDEDTERNNAGVITSTGKNIDLTKVIAKIFKDINPTSPEGKTFIKNFNEYISKNGATNITYNEADGIISYKDKDGVNQTIDLATLIKAKETLTVFNVKDDGTLVYHDENTKRNAAGKITSSGETIDLTKVVEKIFKEIDPTTEAGKTFIKNFNDYITKNGGANISYDPTDGVISYKDKDGVGRTINLIDLINAKETLTKLEFNKTTKKLIYTPERGPKVSIPASDLISGDILEIIKQPVVLEQIIAAVKAASGQITFDAINKKFVYPTAVNKVDDSGNPVLAPDGSNIKVTADLYLKDIVKDNETVTTLEYDDTTGELIYKNEEAARAGADISKTVKIDIPAKVTQKFKEIINTPANKTEIIKLINDSANGTVTYNEGTKKLEYVVISKNSVGETVKTIKQVPLKDFVIANETVTELSFDKKTGILTYINEEAARDGADPAKTVKFDIPEAITNKFKEIIESGDNIEHITKIFNEKIEGNVFYQGGKLKYIVKEASGTKVIREIPIADFVKLHETVTTLTVVNDKLVYKNEKDTDNGKEVVGIDKVINKFITTPGSTVETVLKDFITEHAPAGISYNETTAVITYGKDNKTINLKDLIKANESKTTLVAVSPNSHVGSDGHKTAQWNLEYTSEADATGSAVTSTIDVTNMVKESETVTTLLVDETETKVDPDTGGTLKKTRLAYTNETGKAEFIDLESLIKSNETLTSLVYDPTDHKLRYRDEMGTTKEYDLIDMVGDIEHLTTLTLDRDAKKLIYKDEKEKVHNLDLAPIIQEPWFGVDSKIGAISNDENIFTKGWVGIGIDKPSGLEKEKLRVNGSISVVNGSYADYVFEDYFDGFSTIKYDYKFNDLKTVEDYIKTNRHLPGITPIHELEKTSEGYSFNISELSIQLLEKTEELYLHMIEQKNVIDQKDQQIKALEEANKAVQERLENLERLLLNK